MVRKPSLGDVQVDISPGFKLIFLSVLFLTVVSMIGASVCAYCNNPSAPNTLLCNLSDKFQATWMLGVGAIFGLLSGKTI